MASMVAGVVVFVIGILVYEMRELGADIRDIKVQLAIHLYEHPGRRSY